MHTIKLKKVESTEMKPNTAFVITMLAMCSVAHPDQVSRDQIRADHVRLMNESLTPESKELILEMASTADETMETVTVTISDDRFVDSGLLAATPEEIILICRIYGSQGREVEITKDALVVSPCERVLQKKRRMQKQPVA